MPWMIKKNDKDLYCVHPKGEDDMPMGESLGCHATEEEAKKHMAAMYAEYEKGFSTNSSNTATTIAWYPETITTNTTNPVVDSMSLTDAVNSIKAAWEEEGEIDEVFTDSVIACVDGKYWRVPYEKDSEIKFADKSEWKEVAPEREWVEKRFLNKHVVKSLGENRIGGYGILWGDEENKDLHGEFFTKNTKDLTTIFDVVGALPSVVHHGASDKVGKFVVGKVDKLEADETGLWWEAAVTEHDAYKKYVKPLIDRKIIFSSSGTLPAAKRVKKSGEITRWAIAEMTLTHLPAEWRMLEVPIEEIKGYYKSINIDFPTDSPNKGSEKERLEIEKLRLKLL